MTNRSIERIQADMEKAQADYEKANERRMELRRELAAAKLRDAAEKGHPWLGMRLKRSTLDYRGRDRVERGRLTIFDPNKHNYGIRKLHSVAAGDLFVITDSGRTGYRFAEGTWELAE